MIALDTETTGVDFNHASRPFFVTTCTADGDQVFWEWDVDPLTRRVLVPDGDVAEIAAHLRANAPYVLQNPKFDVHALRTVGLWDEVDVDEFWNNVDDTLTAGHVLASGMPHDLTSMTLQYADVDIEPLERALEAAVKECRRLVAREFPAWRVSREDDVDAPSVKGKAWAADYWLPRAYAIAAHLPAGHAWWTVLRDYANADSYATLAVWRQQERLLGKRKLTAIYREKRKLLRIAYDMECGGLTVVGSEVGELVGEYKERSADLERECVSIARARDFDLVLPKSGRNASLNAFVFDVLQLEKIRDRKAKTDAPTLNRAAIDHYLDTLDAESDAWRFVSALAQKRSLDTALQYVDGYSRFWLPMRGYEDGRQWFVVYPTLNPNGTATLRWSSRGPNEQSISKKEHFNLRRCFGALPEYEWWSFDAAGIEDCIPTFESKQDELMEIFLAPDKPPYYGSNHLLRFHTVYPDLWDAAVKEVGFDKAGPYVKKKYASTWYKYAKCGGFCMQYGGQEALADATFHRKGSYARIRSRLSKLTELSDRWKAFAHRHGYVETIPDRTVDPTRGYPMQCSRGDSGFISPTIPFAYHVQGTAMQWTNKAMVRVDELLAQWRRDGFNARIVMQVHDELVVEFPRRGDPRKTPGRGNLPRAREVQRVMSLGGDDIGVPTPVGAEYHPRTWAEGVAL